MSDNQGVTPEHLRNLGNLPANEASDGVSLRDETLLRIQVNEALRLIKFEIEYAETHGGCPPAVRTTHRTGDSKAANALMSLIHHHDQRIIAEAERRGGVEALGRLIETESPWPEDVFGRIPKGEWHEIDEFAKTRGYRIDDISAELMRRGWLNLVRIAAKNVADLTAQRDGNGEQKEGEE